MKHPWLAVCLFLLAVLPRRPAPPRRSSRTSGSPPTARPDCSSLKSIVESVTRDCKTDDERAIAIYNFGRFAWYHHAYPSESCGDIGALKMINVYGWSLCGGQHTVLAALYEAAGLQVALPRVEQPRPHHRRVLLRRAVALPGHLPQVLLLDGGPRPPRPADHRRAGRHQGRPVPGHRAVRHRRGPQGLLPQGQRLRLRRPPPELGGAGLHGLRRRPARRPVGDPQQQQRRQPPRLGGPEVRRPRLLHRRRPLARLRASRSTGTRSKAPTTSAAATTPRSTPAATRSSATAPTSARCSSPTASRTASAPGPTAPSRSSPTCATTPSWPG